jgi:hypothetical protein
LLKLETHTPALKGGVPGVPVPMVTKRNRQARRLVEIGGKVDD